MKVQEVQGMYSGESQKATLHQGQCVVSQPHKAYLADHFHSHTGL